MAMKYDSRSCTVTTTWEWVMTGYTPVTETEVTEQREVTVTRTWHRYAGEWQAGSLSWGSVDGMSLVSQDYIKTEPQQPQHWAAEGSTYTTSGIGVGTYKGKKKSGGDPIYGWGHYSTSHGHSSSISYDDGTYAGTLSYDSCSGSASSPSWSGSSAGQRTTTNGSGTAYYSGDVPVKGGGGDPDPTPTLGVVAKNITDTSVRATIEGLMFEANYYHLFEMELWRGNEAEYLITQSWKDSSNQKYTSFDFSGLNAGSTYTLKGFVKSTSTGGRTHAGTKVFSTTGTATTRPTDWTWTTLNSAATSYTFGKLRANLVSAKEWNDFCSEINKFRAYKNLPAVTFTTAITNFDFTSAMYEQAKSAISNMATVNVPSGFYSKLVALKDALNSIQ
jgi:hypothetical protein